MFGVAACVSVRFCDLASSCARLTLIPHEQTLYFMEQGLKHKMNAIILLCILILDTIASGASIAAAYEMFIIDFGKPVEVLKLAIVCDLTRPECNLCSGDRICRATAFISLRSH